MRKKLLTLLLAMTLVLTAQTSVFAAGESKGEEWVDFNPGVNIALYFSPKEEVEQTYTLGDFYEFTSDTYCSSAKGTKGKRNLEVKALNGSDSKGIQSVEYMDGETWKDISGFNASIILANDVDRAFRIVFVKDGSYSIRQTFASDDGKIRLTTKVRYAIVKNGTILITRTAPEIPTTEETTGAEQTTVPATTKAVTKKSFLKTCPVVKVKSAAKKKSSKKIKITLKKAVKQADGYIVCIYKKKTNAKKNKKVYVKNIITGKKVSFQVAHKYLRKQKKLYVRVCAYKVINNKIVVSKKWSAVKKVKIKK